MSAASRLLRVVLPALLALLCLVATATPAQAHAALLSTTPGDSEVLQTSPTEVTLTFGEPVGLALGNVRVVDATGKRVDVGSPRRTDGGKVVRAAVRPDLATGSYVVLWRVISLDAHPVSGAFTFSVGQPSAPAKELLGSGNLTQLTEQPRSPGVALGVSRFLGFAGLVVLLGGAVFCLLLWPAGLRTLRTPLRIGALGVTVSAVAALVIQGPYASGNGLGRVLDAGLLSAVLPTQFGTATAIRAGAGLLALLVLWRASGRIGAASLVALGVVAAVGSAASGHAGVGEWQPYALIADATHLVTVAAWTGGLVVLGLGLRRHWSEDDQERLLPAWSRLATWSVVLLVLTGTFASLREVGSLEALVTTTYGRLLIAKLALVGVMLLLGLAGRAYVRERYRPAEGEDVPEVAQLRRSTLVETSLAVVVLVVTAFLVNTTPAKDAYAPPYVGRSQAGPFQVQLDVYPARVGRNGVHLYTAREGGRTVDVAQVSGYAERADGERVTLEPRRASLGHYEDLAVFLPSKGTWTFVLQIRSSDIDSHQTQQSVRVR